MLDERLWEGGREGGRDGAREGWSKGGKKYINSTVNARCYITNSVNKGMEKMARHPILELEFTGCNIEYKIASW